MSDAYGVAPVSDAEISSSSLFAIFFVLQSPVILLCHGAIVRIPQRERQHISKVFDPIRKVATGVDCSFIGQCC
jgi:hypothetical protein